jgi:hypothetical protein
MVSNTRAPRIRPAAERDHFELQLADGAEDHVVVAQRLEQLRRALLAQLAEALGSCFILSGSLSTARRNSSGGASSGMPVTRASLPR